MSGSGDDGASIGLATIGPALGGHDGGPDDAPLSVRFWGTRGSVATPGQRTVRYGGNTPCIEVRMGQRLFLLDAGTGIVGAGEALISPGASRFDVLFSHLHHDHTLGFPFFKPVLGRRNTIRTFCGNLGGESAAEALNTMFAPPLFPVRLDALPARIEHVGFRAGEVLTIDGVDIATCPLFHPGGATGYRFDHGGRSICYICDIEHTDPWPASYLVRFCRGADLVIFDCMYTASEYPVCKGWGHSTWSAGAALCQAANAKAMAGFHHHPSHSDADLDALQADLAAALPGSFMAREGQVVSLAARRELVGALPA